MTKKTVGAALLALLLAACGRDRGAHLPADKMERVLLDIQLAEVYGSMAGADSAHGGGLRNRDSLAVFYREVLDHHHITFEEFRQSLDWYREHPDKLDTIYVHAMSTLDRDENSLHVAPRTPEPGRDSVIAARTRDSLRWIMKGGADSGRRKAGRADSLRQRR